MLSSSLLLGWLAKSGKGNNNQQIGDSKVLVPGTFLPTLRIPYPTLSLFASPPAGGTTAVLNSWAFYQQALFNVTGNTVLIMVQPGLWSIDWELSIEERGAVSDATSTCQLAFILNDMVTNQLMVLATITNKQGVNQIHKGTMELLVPSELTYQFNRTTVVGAGTGTNACSIYIKATRLF